MNNFQLSPTFRNALVALQKEVIQRGDLPHISLKELLSYIDRLTKFPLGRSLIETRAIDTFWTDFIITNDKYKSCSDLENFILTRSPFTTAWRELLENFQKLTQENLKNNIVLASIPCGAMREILELNYSEVSDFKLIGIDIDANSLSLARQLAIKKKLCQHLVLDQKDAWKLPYFCEIDIITSCGLNIYVSDPQKVLNLYRQFFQALKPGGLLILSFLTYPPGEGQFSEWVLNKIPSTDLFLEKVLYKDILNTEWRNFRTSEEIENELKVAGFSEITFHYDTLHIFPSLVAKKGG